MKDNNYIVIQGWMVNNLKLSGNELMVYALIYGFSQDEKSGYEGGGKYLSVSCGVSPRTLTVLLNKLLEKNYILKEHFIKNINGKGPVKFCRYKTNPDFIPKNDKHEQKRELKKEKSIAEGIAETAIGGMAETAIGGIAETAIGGIAETAIGYSRNCHRGIAETANNINTNINLNNNTTTAAPEHPDSNTDPPPDDKKGTAAAAVTLTPDKIKNSLSALDNRLFFDKSFYSRAEGFLSHHKLDLKYLDWLHEQCVIKNQNPDSFDGLYYTLFFAENMAEKYNALNKPPPPKTPPPPENVKCPACGTVHPKNIELCPGCSLPKDSMPIQISLFSELLTFPADRRDEYLKRENVIYSEFKGDFVKIKTMIDSLKKEFSLGVALETPSRNYHP